MEQRRVKSFVSGMAVMLVIAALVVINGRWSLEHCGKLRGPVPGKDAPAFQLPKPDGKTLVKLGDLRGKVALLDFWATWCKPCLRKMPQLEALQRELGKRGLQVVGINVEGSPERVRRFMEARARRFKDAKAPGVMMLVDDGRVSASYGVRTLPHVAVVDRKGKLVHVQVGARGHDRLRAAVLAALEDGK
ncbi:MAG: TlpA family protein disulfide reductase [Myxococcales bacterium]|nr:TlpA family protein disulfide reductase [Myxococcales bacterium]